MKLGDFTVSGWLGQGPGHQLFRGHEGLVYRFAPNASQSEIESLKSTSDTLVAAMREQSPPGPILQGTSTEGEAILVALNDPTAYPLTGMRDQTSMPVALGLACSLLRYLRPLHARGLYHGAINIERTLLNDAGEVMVMDVGAGLFAQSIHLNSLRPNTPGFTDLYLDAHLVPPELLSQKTLCTATDVYIVAAMSFRWLTGYSAFAGRKTMEIYRRIKTGQRRKIRDLGIPLPMEVMESLESALDPDPANRMEPETLHEILSGYQDTDLSPLCSNLGIRRRWSRAMKIRGPENAPGPAGSKQELLRQRRFRQATLELDTARSTEKPGRRVRRLSLLLGVILLGLMALLLTQLKPTTQPEGTREQPPALLDGQSDAPQHENDQNSEIR